MPHQLSEKCDGTRICNDCLPDVIIREPIHPKCDGCNRIIPQGEGRGTDARLCKAYAQPSIKWRNDWACPLATHIVIEADPKEKKRAGQQKTKRKK